MLNAIVYEHGMALVHGTSRGDEVIAVAPDGAINQELDVRESIVPAGIHEGEVEPVIVETNPLDDLGLRENDIRLGEL